MAEFSGFILTNKGRELLAKAVAGETLTFTKIGFGDGLFDGEKKEAEELAGLKNIFFINQIKKTAPGQVSLKTVITNRNIETGYHIREIGIYAVCEGEEEVLYAYNTAIEADYLPPFNGNNLIELEYQNYIVIDQAEKVTAIIDPSATYLTKEEAEEIYVPQTQVASKETTGIISENRVLDMIKSLAPQATANTIKFENGYMFVIGMATAGKKGTQVTNNFYTPFIEIPVALVVSHTGFVTEGTHVTASSISGSQFIACSEYATNIGIAYVAYGRWK